MKQERQFFEQQAKEMLLNLRLDKDLTFSELARRLSGFGAHISTRALTNKLHRGTYSFAFALQVLAALGETSVRVPTLPAGLPKGRSKSPAGERQEES